MANRKLTPEERAEAYRLRSVKNAKPIADRFWSKVDKTGDCCWIWRSAINDTGYGVFYIGPNKNYPRMVRAHRWAYEEANGRIPDGLVLDHLCRNPRCVNPAHLRACTIHENNHADGSLQNARKTHCDNGHPFDSENTRRTDRGARDCRACVRERANERYQRQIAKGLKYITTESGVRRWVKS